jgi:hypothetical protein
MSKRRRKTSKHEIVSRGRNVFNESQVICSCGTKCNDGLELTADEVFQLHRESVSATP